MRVSPSPLVVPRASRPRLTRLPGGGFARISPKKEEEEAVEADAGDGLSAYELVRLRNIAERTRMMESLALVEGFRQLKQQGRRRNTIGGGGVAKKTPAEFPRRPSPYRTRLRARRESMQQQQDKKNAVLETSSSSASLSSSSSSSDEFDSSSSLSSRYLPWRRATSLRGREYKPRRPYDPSGHSEENFFHK